MELKNLAERLMEYSMKGTGASAIGALAGLLTKAELRAAYVALMADDLAHLPFAVGLSRHTRGIIRQNVFVSLGVVAFLVPATILGLGIGPAVAVPSPLGGWLPLVAPRPWCGMGWRELAVPQVTRPEMQHLPV